MKQQNAWVDSEYDPYHDGCTDIFVAYLSDEDTEFTLPDMLDCYIEFAYIKADNDEWSLMEKRETNETINIEYCNTILFFHIMRLSSLPMTSATLTSPDSLKPILGGRKIIS